MPQYLTAIAESAGPAGLGPLLEGSVRELLALARQLGAAQLATSVPTISSEQGVIQRQGPLPFVRHLSAEHVLGHLGRLRELAAQATT